MKTLILLIILTVTNIIADTKIEPNTKKINMLLQSYNDKVKIVKFEFNDFLHILRYTLDSSVYDYYYQVTIYDDEVKKFYEIDINHFFLIQNYTLIVDMAGIIKALHPMKPLFLSIYLKVE